MQSDAELIETAQAVARELGGVFIAPELAKRLIAICEQHESVLFRNCGCHILDTHKPDCAVAILANALDASVTPEF